MNVQQNQEANEQQVKVRKRKWPKRLAIVLLVAIVAGCVGFFAYASDYYHAGQTATESLEQLEGSGELQETNDCIVVGSDDSLVGIILYPGAKVDPVAYVPLALELADKGYCCVIAKMPFNLAFFGIDSATGIMEECPDVDQWWLAGHSLGGAMAASYASSHADELQGLFLLAAYSTNDLSETDLSVETLYGSNDGVLNRDALNEDATNLPDGAITKIIEGGNHAGFGDYGPQDGDGESTIGARAQWEQTATCMDETIRANQ